MQNPLQVILFQQWGSFLEFQLKFYMHNRQVEMFISSLPKYCSNCEIACITQLFKSQIPILSYYYQCFDEYFLECCKGDHAIFIKLKGTSFFQQPCQWLAIKVKFLTSLLQNSVWPKKLLMAFTNIEGANLSIVEAFSLYTSIPLCETLCPRTMPS